MKKYICIWIAESLCCTPETNTTLWVSYNSIEKKKTQGNECQWGCGEQVCTVGEKANWHSLCGRQFGCSRRTLK